MMGDRSPIEWLRGPDGRPGATWPFINGCRRVSEGCRNCYAERLTATRLSKTPKYEGLAVMTEAGPRWTGKARLWPEHLAWPMRWKRPRRIFPVDMGDLFYEGVTDTEIAAGYGVMAACPQHTFILLTKRPERARDWYAWAEKAAAGRFVGPALAEHAACHFQSRGDTTTADLLFTAANRASGRTWPLTNVWLGVSVEDQARATVMLDALREISAELHHVSIEPQLSEIDIRPWLDFLGWGIVGGESGPGARRFHIEWARAIVRQFQEAGKPIFVKQLGSNPHTEDGRGVMQDGGRLYLIRDRKGADIEEWPADLRIQEWPRSQSHAMEAQA